MKRAARIICALFASAIVLCHFCVFAGVSNGEAVIVMDAVSGMPGQTVEVNMTLTKNPGITGLRFFVAYDKDALTLQSAEYTKIGGGGLISVNTKNNPFILLWNVSTYEFTETGVLCKMTFKINDGAKAGDVPLKVTYGKGDCIDYDLKNLTMDITDGVVKVLYDGTNCEHKNTQKNTLEPSSCKKAGKYEVRCNDCSSVVGGGDLPIAEHSYGTLIVTKLPTFNEFGRKEQKCSVCGDVRTEQIPKLERDEEETITPESHPDTSKPAPDTEDAVSSDTAVSDTAVSDSKTDTYDTTPQDTAVATGDDTVILAVLASVSAVLILVLVACKIKRKRKWRK